MDTKVDFSNSVFVADFISSSLTKDARSKNISINRMGRHAANLFTETSNEGESTETSVKFSLGEGEEDFRLIFVKVDHEKKQLTVVSCNLEEKRKSYALVEYAQALRDARRCITLY